MNVCGRCWWRPIYETIHACDTKFPHSRELSVWFFERTKCSVRLRTWFHSTECDSARILADNTRIATQKLMGRTSLWLSSLITIRWLVINLHQRVFFLLNPFALSLLVSSGCWFSTLPIRYIADVLCKTGRTKEGATRAISSLLLWPSLDSFPLVQHSRTTVAQLRAILHRIKTMTYTA